MHSFSDINALDTFWVTFTSLLVLLMVIPGMALFYAGMVSRKNTLSVVIQVTSAFVVGLFLWVIFGYSIVFTEFNSIIGGLDKIGLKGTVNLSQETFLIIGNIPELSFVIFQGIFAGLSCALIVGALVERIKLVCLLVFVTIWFVFSYLPVAHMVWFSSESHPGWLFKRGALDFAGGTVVHINAGAAAIVGALMIGRRKGFDKEILKPHNLIMTYIGVAFLWVGWFGFNSGSALEMSFNAIISFFNTLIAGLIGLLTWAFIDQIKHKKISLLGLCSGLISGLVGITPAAAYVGFLGAIFISIITTVCCYFVVELIKHRYKIDDSLDVFGIHGMGGVIGALLTGIFCFQFFGGTQSGGFIDLLWQLWIQLEGVLITLIWSCSVSFVGIKILHLVFKEPRVSLEQETQGLDISLHSESIY
ncbi:ammonium transporter [Thorsellia kenyensis]|uniref:Ammonium transporter n=1 Tax=Thorsellia kenyensis TaxID=1549888 RepID=A0ABV6C7H5_9GAMM